MATINITDASFEEDVLKSDKPVVLDFWAPWCGPCKMIGPSLEEISDEMADKITVAKINIDRFGLNDWGSVLLSELFDDIRWS